MFSFGGSKSSSSSQATASSLDASRSGGISSGISGGESVGGSESSQSIAFEDIFSRLFGGAEGAAAGLDPSMLTDTANQLFSGGIDFLDSLGGGVDTEFLQSRITGENPLLGEQIAGLGDDLGEFFNEQILPGISSEAVAGGSLGGSRQGVAEGIAGRDLGRTFARGVTDLRAADIADRTRAAESLGANRIAGAQAGLAGLPTLAGISDYGFGAELAPYERLAALIGGPTVIGESSSFSNAEDFARNFAQNFAQSFGTSQSQSTSKSDSVAVRMGMS